MLLKTGRIFLGLLLVAIFAGHSASWYRLPLLTELETIMLDMRIRAITLHKMIVLQSSTLMRKACVKNPEAARGTGLGRAIDWQPW